MNTFATGGTLFCLVGAVLIVGLIIVWSAIKIVPEYQRLVVFRLGRVLSQPKGPGIVLIFPGIDTVKWVDLREQIREVPHQVSITKDNAPISIDFLWYYKILDPAMSVLQVGNFELSAAGIAATTLRAWLWICAFATGGWVVNWRVKDTRPSWMVMPWTRPRLTISSPAPGS